MLILSRQDVVRLLDIDAMLGALEQAFVCLSAGEADVPPRIAARAPGGLLGAMPGWLPGTLAAKLVTVFPGNEARGIPSHQGVIVLVDEASGAPLALLDAAHITAMRTAGGSAVSARHLARHDAGVLAILGAGVQGRSHLDVMPRIREFGEIRVASRTPAHAAALVAKDPRAVVSATFEAAVRGADVVCCCTDAHEPVIDRAWLADGCHVTSVGGTFGPELDATTVASARVFVESRSAVTSPPTAGARELQGMDPADVTELGEVIAGTRPGRVGHAELTLYKSTGHAVEDCATARLVHDRAVAEGVGVEVAI
jgi:ornithine cyclodeaminase/alanine dehydrogenase-like protein (mu-crystallin family)